MRGKQTKLGEGEAKLGEGERKVRLGQDSLPNKAETSGDYIRCFTCTPS